jgi:peptide-methionine (R)-S-oxide reductase
LLCVLWHCQTSKIETIMARFTAILFILLVEIASAFTSTHHKKLTRTIFNNSLLKGKGLKTGDDIVDGNRRKVWIKSASRFASLGIGAAALVAYTRPVWAKSKSRTDGYAVKKSESEWKSMLSVLQYQILRDGGTENPYFSILEGEERTGVYSCAGCGTKLFEAQQKFHSGTGWPSYAQGLQGVEIDNVDPFTASLAGAEVRCATCGGHLGDVFQDGFLFVGTPAFKTGKRFCIDGAALVFSPESGEEAVRGDKPAKKTEASIPSWLESPKISPQTQNKDNNA